MQEGKEQHLPINNVHDIFVQGLKFSAFPRFRTIFLFGVPYDVC